MQLNCLQIPECELSAHTTLLVSPRRPACYAGAPECQGARAGASVRTRQVALTFQPAVVLRHQRAARRPVVAVPTLGHRLDDRCGRADDVGQGREVLQILPHRHRPRRPARTTISDSSAASGAC